MNTVQNTKSTPYFEWMGTKLQGLAWYIDYSDNLIPQRYHISDKNSTELNMRFEKNIESMKTSVKAHHKWLNSLIKCLENSQERFPSPKALQITSLDKSYISNAQQLSCHTDKILHDFTHEKQSLKNDILLGGFDSSTIDNIFSFICKNITKFPNMKFTIFVNSMTQFCHKKHQSLDSTHLFRNLLHFIENDKEYTLIQDITTQINDYAKKLHLEWYTSFIEIIDIPTLIIKDLGPKYIWLPIRHSSPECIAVFLDFCAIQMRANLIVEDPYLLLSKEEFSILPIDNKLAIMVVYNYLSFYTKKHEFSTDNKAFLKDLIMPCLSSLNRLIAVDLDFFCIRPLSITSSPQIIQKYTSETKFILTLNAYYAVFNASKYINTVQRVTKYYSRSKNLRLTKDYDNLLWKDDALRIVMYTTNLEGNYVFPAHVQSSKDQKELAIKKQMTIVQCTPNANTKIKPHNLLLFLFSPIEILSCDTLSTQGIIEIFAYMFYYNHSYCCRKKIYANIASHIPAHLAQEIDNFMKFTDKSHTFFDACTTLALNLEYKSLGTFSEFIHVVKNTQPSKEFCIKDLLSQFNEIMLKSVIKELDKSFEKITLEVKLETLQDIKFCKAFDSYITAHRSYINKVLAKYLKNHQCYISDDESENNEEKQPWYILEGYNLICRYYFGFTDTQYYVDNARYKYYSPPIKEHDNAHKLRDTLFNTRKKLITLCDNCNITVQEIEQEIVSTKLLLSQATDKLQQAPPHTNIVHVYLQSLEKEFSQLTKVLQNIAADNIICLDKKECLTRLSRIYRKILSIEEKEVMALTTPKTELSASEDLSTLKVTHCDRVNKFGNTLTQILEKSNTFIKEISTLRDIPRSMLEEKLSQAKMIAEECEAHIMTSGNIFP